MAREERTRRRSSSFPIFLAVGALVLLLLLLGYYFENCFKGKDVLGVSTFNSSSSKNPVVNGETFNFNATVVGDQAGALNATVLFTLTGRGAIGSSIGGPGACAKLTDTTAACNNVDIDPNQTITWTVPVTAAGNCSQNTPPSLSLQTRLVATAVTTTSTATATCVASQQSGSSPTSGSNPTTPPSNQGGGSTQPTSSSNGGQSGTTTNNTYNTTSGTNDKGSGNGEDAGGLGGSNLNFAGFACSKVNGFPLVFILFILWVLASAYYFLLRRA